MTSERNKRIVPLLVVAAAMLIGGLAVFRPGPLRWLNADERAFVGVWTHEVMPGEEPLAEMSFRSNRTFRSDDGEFAGRWWIHSGQLHLKLWRDQEPTGVPVANALIRPVANWWYSSQAAVDTWEIKLNESGDRAELLQDGVASEILVRSR